MPLELASSVDVASTARAHRMQRSTSTWTTGLCELSMLWRYEPPDEDPDDRSESEAEYDPDDSELYCCFLDGRWDREDDMLVKEERLRMGEGKSCGGRPGLGLMKLLRNVADQVKV